MKKVVYKKLNKEDIKLSLFSDFNRYQEVKKCWRKENNKWILKDISFIDQWGENEYNFLVKCLINTIETGGVVLGAFCDCSLVGFASVENKFFGSENQYLQLSSLHTSYEYRGNGIGKQLFSIACDGAKDLGAKKLYISSHSSEESQKFYKAVGCVEAIEYNKKLVEDEPCDCQLEYILI
ncbi:GNAT family N-acetyltransferase [uncultured Clostridium sp.]|uniref:GNAT family N-acetyltransferase n=1 Tax=uncultured Clostridium sp. TaxID=59620 RepID=UPI0025EEF69A|nr:GNAT family N-acetyltransferase [uncultured Clostridium sp.]